MIQAAPPQGAPRHWARLALVAACFIVYSNTLGPRPFMADDVLMIQNNDFIRDPANLPKLFSPDDYLSTRASMEFPEGGYGSGELTYRPVATLSYFILHGLFGSEARFYRMLSVALHAVNACLMLAAGEALGLSFGAALLAALFFGVHPMSAETVNIVSFNEEPLVFFFLMSAFLLRQTRRNSLGFCALLYGLACFTKENAVLFYPILWFHDAVLKRPAAAPDKRRELLAYAGVTALFLFMRFGVFASSWDAEGPARPVWAVFSAYARHLLHFVWPLPFRPSLLEDASLYVRSLPAVALALLLPGLVWFCRRRNPPISFFIAWFLVFLFPSAWMVRGIVAGRHAYLPSAGIFWAMATALAAFRGPWKKIAALMAGLFIAQAAFSTLISNLHWKSEKAFFSLQAQADPQNALSHFGLANVLARGGEFGEAAVEYRAALALAPARPDVLDALGLTLSRGGYPEKGVVYCQKAVELDPDSAVFRTHLGMVYGMAQKWPESEMEFRRALELDPARAEPWDGLGVLHARQGEIAEARRDFQRALEKRPGYGSAARHLAALPPE